MLHVLMTDNGRSSKRIDTRNTTGFIANMYVNTCGGSVFRQFEHSEEKTLVTLLFLLRLTDIH